MQVPCRRSTFIAAEVLTRCVRKTRACIASRIRWRSGFHRQHAARRWRIPVDDDCAGGDRRLRPAGVRAARQSRHIRCRPRKAQRRLALSGGEQRQSPWVLDPVFIDRSPPRAAYAKALLARGPAAIRLDRNEFFGFSGGGAGQDALNKFAGEHSTAFSLRKWPRLQ